MEGLVSLFFVSLTASVHGKWTRIAVLLEDISDRLVPPLPVRVAPGDNIHGLLPLLFLPNFRNGLKRCRDPTCSPISNLELKGH